MICHNSPLDPPRSTVATASSSSSRLIELGNIAANHLDLHTNPKHLEELLLYPISKFVGVS